MLYIVATPIGNMEDLTFRARRILGEVDALACEDTRRTRKLFEKYAIARPGIIFSYHEHNQEQAGKRILGLLRNEKSVALCTNAGYPGISDPGYRIIAEAWDAGSIIRIIPGPGAVQTALLASGLPSSSYIFKGFAPRKSGPRKRFLAMERESPHTLIFFESPHRIGTFLEDACTVLGNRLASVCIELTKKFEQVHRDYLENLVSEFREKSVRGEVTIVISGNNPKFYGA